MTDSTWWPLYVSVSTERCDSALHSSEGGGSVWSGWSEQPQQSARSANNLPNISSYPPDSDHLPSSGNTACSTECPRKKPSFTFLSQLLGYQITKPRPPLERSSKDLFKTHPDMSKTGWNFLQTISFNIIHKFSNNCFVHKLWRKKILFLDVLNSNSSLIREYSKLFDI